MLLSSSAITEIEEGFVLLQELINAKGIWLHAFWSIIGKLPENALVPRLFDLFYPALSMTKGKERNIIKNALSTMSKFSVKGAEMLASALLWSTLLPNVLRWSDIGSLQYISDSELKHLARRLVVAYEKERTYTHLSVVNYGQLLDWVLPYMKDEIALRINESIKLRGRPKGNDFRGVMHIVRDLFPEHQCYLLNGIFHQDNNVSRFCTDRIRFVRHYKKAVAFLCKELADVVESEEVKFYLLNSADWIEYHY